MCCKMVSLKTVLFDYLKIVIFGAFEVEWLLTFCFSIKITDLIFSTSLSNVEPN